LSVQQAHDRYSHCRSWFGRWVPFVAQVANQALIPLRRLQKPAKRRRTRCRTLIIPGSTPCGQRRLRKSRLVLDFPARAGLGHPIAAHTLPPSYCTPTQLDPLWGTPRCSNVGRMHNRHQLYHQSSAVRQRLRVTLMMTSAGWRTRETDADDTLHQW
jgi:hypothetical protein